jgi:hypothetical protein
VKPRIVFRWLAWTCSAVGLGVLNWSVACAQEPPALIQWLPALEEQSAPAETQQPPSAPPKQQPPTNVAQGCIEPAPMVRLEDYQGPFRKIIGTFAGRIERRTVHQPRYKPGAKLCTFLPKDKFILFLEDSVDPGTFLTAGFNAGLDQAQNTDPSFGQGAQGYGRRFGAEMAGQATSRFFQDFAYPSIFSEDPRYYRMGTGPVRKRLAHAIVHSVLAYRDNGNRMFNFSEWLGTASTVAVVNTFHPDYQRGFAPAAERVGYAVLQDIGFDVLREFWPEISRKFKLPFRGESAPIVVRPISPSH